MKLIKLALAALSVTMSLTGSAHARTSVPVPESHHFVFVHGAWHGAWSWFEVQSKLEEQGHVATAIDLQSHGADKSNPAAVTLADYTQKVVDYLDSVADPVILVGHSMGGIVISSAAEARPAKVSKLVYVAAFLVPNGSSMLDLASIDTQSVVGQNLIVGPGVIDVAPSAWEEAFYGQTKSEYITLARSLLVTNPIQPIATPLSLTDANFGSVRRFYVKTRHDKAITPTLQDKMVTDTPCEEVFEIDSDHSPFFSRPNKLINALLKIGADSSVT